MSLEIEAFSFFKNDYFLKPLYLIVRTEMSKQAKKKKSI